MATVFLIRLTSLLGNIVTQSSFIANFVLLSSIIPARHSSYFAFWFYTFYYFILFPYFARVFCLFFSYLFGVYLGIFESCLSLFSLENYKITIVCCSQLMHVNNIFFEHQHISIFQMCYNEEIIFKQADRQARHWLQPPENDHILYPFNSIIIYIYIIIYYFYLTEIQTK